MVHRFWLPIVEVGLWLAAGLAVLLALLWTVGLSGTGWVDLGDLPGSTAEVALRSETLWSWSQPPRTGALFTDPGDQELIFSTTNALSDLGPDGSGLAPRGYADPTLGTGLSFTDASWGQHGAWAALHAATWLGLAGIAVTLATLVRSSRTATPFTARNATRLTRLAGVLIVGGLLVSVGRWALLAWMTATSSVADRVEGPSYDLLSVPWGTIAAGAGLLVLAGVWRRGVVMARDLEGLV